ncbi:unnamed protein product [Dracunculus medinensis]|uniref:EGF-like domain-containing protein n=1 Tax=Dracunculus medinensis TaxID=318479 RepID=A0A0N4UF62_DRAME|nr:unnamed protein product [Dracunculus medinensis]
MCDSSDCNNQGTCIGNKQTYFCVCRLGYTGTKCETTLCDSDRDCNQKGICSGTSADFKCLCNIGFTGDKCEIPLHVKS